MIYKNCKRGYLYELSSTRGGILSRRCTMHMQTGHSVHAELVWRDSNANMIPPRVVVHKEKKLMYVWGGITVAKIYPCTA